MQSAIEIVKNLARQRAQGESSPLLLLHPIEARHGTLISHLPIANNLLQTWVELTGSPFCQHQSLSLASWRRGEPFALTGGGVAAYQTLHFLLRELLLSAPEDKALFVLPNDEMVDFHLHEIEKWNTSLNTPLTASYVDMEKITRQALASRIVLTTPDVLHERLLRHHDRAWGIFWQHLRHMLLPDIDRYNGIALAHLTALLRRSMRLIPHTPALAATLGEAENLDTTLQAISSYPWWIIPADDTPHRATTLAVWRAGNECLRDVGRLALHCARPGYHVQIVCTPMEKPLFLAHSDREDVSINVGTIPSDADITIFAGYPGTHTHIRRACNGSFTKTPHLTILVLGNLPLEHAIARQTKEHHESTHAMPLLDTPPPMWIAPPDNAYIAAQHLMCAASERPLREPEIQEWQAQDIVAHLVQHKKMARLPGSQASWHPLPAIGDPYAHFGLSVAGMAPIFVYNEHVHYIDTLDPALFDRWGFPGATMPIGRSSYRVVDWDEENGRVFLTTEHQQRRTFPLRRCDVTVREEREHTRVRGRFVGMGRVVIEEEIYGYREVEGENPSVDYDLAPPLITRWAAPALWVSLAVKIDVPGQLIGWSLASALPARLVCNHTDLVPAYDAGLSRLYFIEAQPGGNGVSSWVYHHFEALLPFAYDVALACRSDALLEPLSRIDMDWLLTLLGGDVALPETVASRARTDAPHKAATEQRSEPPIDTTSTQRQYTGTPTTPDTSVDTSVDKRLPVVEKPRPPTPTTTHADSSHGASATPASHKPHKRATAKDEAEQPAEQGQAPRQEQNPEQAGRPTKAKRRQRTPKQQQASDKKPPTNMSVGQQEDVAQQEKTDAATTTRSRTSSMKQAQPQEPALPTHHRDSNPVEKQQHSPDSGTDEGIYQEPAQEDPEEEPPDANAILARLRRQREQGETHTKKTR